MATKANLKIDQGADYFTSVNLTYDDDSVVNLSGYTGAGQIRKYYTSSSSVNFVVNIVANTGVIELSLDANTTNNMSAGRYVYDVEVTDQNGVISRVLEGIVTVNPNVTR